MELLSRSALIAATTLVAMTYLGYGLSRLLIPRRSASDVILWAPFVGYAFMSVVFHALNVDLMDGRQTTVVLFVAGTAVNVLAFVIHRRLECPPGRLFASLVGVTGVVFLIGVAPVLSIGSLTAIGKNYDLIDVYDATASYVIDYPVRAIRTASPPNPLADLVVGQVTMSNGWGLSYLHALASILTGYSTIETQTPVFSLMHALIVPASFLFFSRTLALSPWLALVLSAGLGFHGALLSMLFIGLGNHITILTLLPLILASTFSAMDDRRRRGVALASIMIANIPLTYWPTFAFFLPAAAAYAVLGARPWRSMVPLERVAILAATGVGSLLLAIPGYLRVLETFLGRPPLSSGWGHSSFVDLGVLFGFSYWTYPAPPDVRTILGEARGGVLLVVESVATSLALVLALGAIAGLPRRQRAILASLAINFVGMLVILRFVSPYPYAFLKALTFATLVVIPLVVLGLHVLWTRGAVTISRIRLGTRPLVGVVGPVFGALLLLNAWFTTAFFFDQTPTVFTGSVLPPSSLQLREMVAAIPPGVPVFMSETPPFRPEIASALALFLKDHPIYGEIKTLQSRLSNLSDGGTVPEFGVLAASEDPTDRGYDWEDVIWANADVRLYRRGSTVAHWWFRGPNTLSVATARPLRLALTPSGIEFGDAVVPNEEEAHGVRQLVLEMATLTPQTVDILVDGQARSIRLEAGLSRYSLESRLVPADVTVMVNGDASVFVRSVTLRDVADAQSSLVEKRDVLVVAPVVEVHGDRVSLRVQYAGAEAWTDRMAIGLNVGGNASPFGDWNELGWWGTSLRRSDVRVDFDLSKNEVVARTPLEQLRVNSVPGRVRDGNYTAAINFWEEHLASLGWHSSFFGLFQFRIRNGQVLSAESIVDPVFFLPGRHNYPLSTQALARFDGELAALRNELSPGARIVLGPGLRRTPSVMGALAQGLRDLEVYADFLTGADYPEAGRVYEFGILHPNEDPLAFGYRPEDRLLVNSDFVLYRRGSSLAHLYLKQGDSYPRLDADETARVYVDADQITTHETRGPSTTKDVGHRQITVTLASLGSADGVITVGGGVPRVVRVGPGVFHYETEPVAVPTAISITSTGTEPLFLLSVDMASPTSAVSKLVEDDDVMLLSTKVRPKDGAKLDLELRWAGGGDPSRLFFVGLNLNGFAVPDGRWFSSSWWGVPIPSHDVLLEVDLESRRVTANGEGQQLPVSAANFERIDGDYNAELSLWERGLVSQGWPVPFIRLFESTSRRGQITNVVGESTELAVIPLLMPGRETSLPAVAIRPTDAMTPAPTVVAISPTDAVTPTPTSAPATRVAVGPPSAGATINVGGAWVSATPATAVLGDVPGAAMTTPHSLQTTAVGEVATVAAAPMATPTASLHTVLDERFADNRRNWPNDPRATAWFADGTYRLLAREPGRFVAIGAPIVEPLRDVVVTARFRKIGGPPGGGYGLIVRDHGPGRRDGINQGGRYYVLEVGDRGELGIWRREVDHWVDIIPWTPSEAVRPGDAANELTVWAIGQQLTFLVNGTAVASETDSVLPEGAVGIFVGGDFNEAVLDSLLIQIPS